jgi:hypothetical protein
VAGVDSPEEGEGVILVEEVWSSLTAVDAPDCRVGRILKTL